MLLHKTSSVTTRSKLLLGNYISDQNYIVLAIYAVKNQGGKFKIKYAILVP